MKEIMKRGMKESLEIAGINVDAIIRGALENVLDTPRYVPSVY